MRLSFPCLSRSTIALFSLGTHCRSMSSTTSGPKALSIQGIDASQRICKHIVPPLTASSHKGQMGRIGVLGGSPDYTGAPYYSAASALKFGADLIFVYCAKQAAGPIKSYSPELMVTPFYDADNIAGSESPVVNDRSIKDMVLKLTDSFPRLHTLVIGPGLGRDPTVGTAVAAIISEAIKAELPLVIDADGLWFVGQDLSVIHGCSRCVISPNAAEFDRLVKTVLDRHATDANGNTSTSSSSVSVSDAGDSSAAPPSSSSSSSSSTPAVSDYIEELKSDSEVRRVRGLSRALGGVTVIRKGAADIISAGDDVIVVNSQGSPRRCGGQGDILAGCLGVASYWSSKRVGLLPSDAQIHDIIVSGGGEVTTIASSNLSSEGLNEAEKHLRRAQIWGAVLASVVTKAASARAFAINRRSMTSPDVIKELGRAFEDAVGVELA